MAHAMRARALSRLFDGVIGGLLGSSVLAGCTSAPLSASDPNAPPDPQGACGPSFAATEPSELGLAADVDYFGEYFAGPPASESLHTGTACAHASNAAACQQAFAALAPTDGWTSPPQTQGNGMQTTERYFCKYTRGDQVGAITNNQEFVAFVGPIDTPARASFLASLEWHSAACADLRAGHGGYYWTETVPLCNSNNDEQQTVWFIDASGTITQISTQVVSTGQHQICGTGRRPAGFVAARRRRRGVGAFLAQVAELEAASVFAFARLRREIAGHGAPRGLVRACERALRDEVRHARTMAAHAARYGSASPAPRVRAPAVRSLADVAAENAAEGCVRETFGALLATVQARTARDRAIARSMRGIARDETRHAAFSWQLAAWVEPRLSPAERRRVVRARADAATSLRRELEAPHDPEVMTRCGLPAPREAGHLFEGMMNALAAARS
jgi:hypothetical protein